MSRRRVLGAGAGGLLAAGLPGRAVADDGRRGPNILWLVSEDNSPFIGAYGDRQARTPAIDRLAREGVRYENSFATAPVCAPSRFAIITGMSPESCGPGRGHAGRRKDPLVPARLPRVPASGRLLLHEQRQDRLQRADRRAANLERLQRLRALAQPAEGRARLLRRSGADSIVAGRHRDSGVHAGRLPDRPPSPLCVRHAQPHGRAVRHDAYRPGRTVPLHPQLLAAPRLRPA
ncbi:sulfatase-like hydrolase/transferase [Spirillospora sp. NPDC048911]|uniref:sulfatase-like hydrolase/transferase n=1 Tax=Spirillospora sp. NPDC048911 TaxID=3364527 RepID=UPI0037135017